MIPLSVPLLKGNELKYVSECISSGWISSAGSFVEDFEKKIADFVGAKYAIACMNGTTGLQVSLLLAGVQENDYVIVPNLTFIASLNSIKYTGATPILIDIDPETWQMDLTLLEDFITNKCYSKIINNKLTLFDYLNDKRVKAVMPVHVLGNMCDMNKLQELCTKFNLDIIEDSTEALGSYFSGQHAGTFGKLGVFSFNGNKIISTGGGGMIVTNDKELAIRAKHITTQAKSKPDEYYHDEIGFNYRLVNVLAAIGVAQMEQIDSILDAKNKIDSFYRDALKDVGDIVFQEVSKDVKPNNWLFTFKTNHKSALLEFLNEKLIQSRPFWVPMNQLPMFANDIYITENNYSNEVYENCISIPCSSGITDEELNEVVHNIKKFFKS
jgi:perosamine synthetase